MSELRQAVSDEEHEEYIAEVMRDWPKGCAPPATGYAEWQNWATAQERHGLKQSKCRRCRRYFFPQEKPEHMTCNK